MTIMITATSHCRYHRVLSHATVSRRRNPKPTTTTMTTTTTTPTTTTLWMSTTSSRIMRSSSSSSIRRLLLGWWFLLLLLSSSSWCVIPSHVHVVSSLSFVIPFPSSSSLSFQRRRIITSSSSSRNNHQVRMDYELDYFANRYHVKIETSSSSSNPHRQQQQHVVATTAAVTNRTNRTHPNHHHNPTILSSSSSSKSHDRGDNILSRLWPKEEAEEEHQVHQHQPQPNETNHGSNRMIDHHDNTTATATTTTTTNVMDDDKQNGAILNNNNHRDHPSVDVAYRSHGMPWQRSICHENPNHDDDNQEEDDTKTLFCMPFYTCQMEYMKQHLTNLRAMPVISSETGRDMSYQISLDGTMRLHTVLFQSDEYRTIRITSLDGGKQAQVYTSVWYPHDNVPLLGIDLLQFNHGKKHVCLCDYQPLHEQEHDHDALYEHLLQPIHHQYSLLHEPMSSRYYDPNEMYFTKYQLLGRHDAYKKEYQHIDPIDMVYQEMYPAYQAYMKNHIEMIHTVQQQQQQRRSSSSLSSSHDTNDIDRKRDDVIQRHMAFDTYASQHDPAHALFQRMFGTEWADDYFYNILFPLSDRRRHHQTKSP